MNDHDEARIGDDLNNPQPPITTGAPVRYGVFAIGENVFGAPAPIRTFPTIDEAYEWADFQPQELGRNWVVRALTAAEIDAWAADDADGGYPTTTPEDDPLW